MVGALGCPSDTELVALLAGEAGRDVVVAFDAHMDDCVACRTLAAAVLRVATRSSGGEATLPSPEDDAEDHAGSTMLVPGDELGRYRIDRVLGAGGMGVVYEAFDHELERRVAVKVVRPRTPDASAHERLLREARIMAKLEDSGVIRVYDVASVEDRVLVVMELVDGTTLRAFQAQKPLEEVLAAYRVAGRALAAAHERGLVHRDFKPDNVLVSEDGAVKVTDFGLATVGRDDEGGETRGVAMGTLPYMPPEQHRGEPVDARADQFAFAAALHEAIYGARPFTGNDSKALVASIAEGPPAPERSEGVPSWIAPVLRRALAFEPRDRFASMDALLDALEAPSDRRWWPWLAAVTALAVVAVGAGGWPATDEGGTTASAVPAAATTRPDATSTAPAAEIPPTAPAAEPRRAGSVDVAPSPAPRPPPAPPRSQPPAPVPTATTASPAPAPPSEPPLEERIEVYLE